MSTIGPGTSSEQGHGTHPRAEVSRAYLLGIVVPVVLAPALAQLTLFVVERVDGQGSGLAAGLGVAVLAAAWVAVLIATVVLGRRFREDRRRAEVNGAVEWRTASIVLLVLPLVLAVPLLLWAIGMAMMASGWS